MLKRQRGDLRNKLDIYQQDFLKLHTRKIKYRADIKPVADEFKRYKEMNEDILGLEQKLSDLGLLTSN